jgi:hypothetical protein
MKFGNEFWLILFREYISPKLFAVRESVPLTTNLLKAANLSRNLFSICIATSTFCQLQIAADSKRLKTATTTIHTPVCQFRSLPVSYQQLQLHLSVSSHNSHTLITVMTNESCYMPLPIHKQWPPQQRVKPDSNQSIKCLQPVSNMPSTGLNPVSCLHSLSNRLRILSPTCSIRSQLSPTCLQPVLNLYTTCLHPPVSNLSLSCLHHVSNLGPSPTNLSPTCL